MLRLQLIGMILVVAIAIVVLITAGGAVFAEPPRQFTPTPAPVVLPVISPTAILEATPTSTRTPTPTGPALAEALEGPTNVRSGPDITAERLGEILPGETYPVLGRAAGTLWYKIQFPDSPTGTAWVFEQVVSLTGDVELIQDIEVSGQPTVDVQSAASTQTIEVMIETPGALETATANAFLAGVVVGGSEPTPLTTDAPLPTYTYPAEPFTIATYAPAQSAAGITPDTGLPPIIPIAGLAFLGLLGLFVAIARR